MRINLRIKRNWQRHDFAIGNWKGPVVTSLVIAFTICAGWSNAEPDDKSINTKIGNQKATQKISTNSSEVGGFRQKQRSAVVYPKIAELPKQLQEVLKGAQAAAARGAELSAAGDFKAALAQNRKAIDLLAGFQIFVPFRRIYIKQYSQVANKLAQSYVDEGLYNDAIALIENVLSPRIAIGDISAERLLKQLSEPGLNTPLTPQQIERVCKLKRALKVAHGHLDYGDLFRAERGYQKIVNPKKNVIPLRW